MARTRLTEAWREAGAEVDAEKAESTRTRLTGRLRRDADKKRRSARAALARMEIGVHDKLFTLASDFAELDSAVTPARGEAVAIGPDPLAVLGSDTYRQELQEWYLPLLDARLEEWQ